MICGFCEHEIEADKPEWVLVSKKPAVNHFCCLGCLSGYVEELEIQEAEENSLVQ